MSNRRLLRAAVLSLGKTLFPDGQPRVQDMVYFPGNWAKPAEAHCTLVDDAGIHPCVEIHADWAGSAGGGIFVMVGDDLPHEEGLQLAKAVEQAYRRLEAA